MAKYKDKRFEGLTVKQIKEMFKKEYLKINATSISDFNNRRNKRFPSTWIFMRVLKIESSNKLLEACKLPVTKKTYTKEQLIGEIQKTAKKLKRSPSIVELSKITGIAKSIFDRYFGNHNKALKASGLKILYKAIKIKYTDEEMIEIYKKHSKKMKRPKGAIAKELIGNARIPSYDTYIKRFGSMENLRKKAGFL